MDVIGAAGSATGTGTGRHCKCKGAEIIDGWAWLGLEFGIIVSLLPGLLKFRDLRMGFKHWVFRRRTQDFIAQKFYCRMSVFRCNWGIMVSTMQGCS